MMALKALGYSMNTSDENQIQGRRKKEEKKKEKRKKEERERITGWFNVQTMKPEIVTDEIIDNMAQGRKALGAVSLSLSLSLSLFRRCDICDQ